MRNKNDTLWGAKDTETLRYSNIDEAIEYELDKINVLPLKFEIFCYRRERVDENIDADRILENIIDNLDERYGDIDGDPTYVNDHMKSAAKVFVATVLKEYVPWTMEPFKSRTIDVKNWVIDHVPHWLKEIEWEDLRKDG